LAPFGRDVVLNSNGGKILVNSDMEVQGRDYTFQNSGVINSTHDDDITLETMSSYLVTATMHGANCEIIRTAIVTTLTSSVRLDIAEQSYLNFNLGSISFSRTGGGAAGTYTGDGNGNSIRISWDATSVSGNCDVTYSVKRFH